HALLTRSLPPSVGAYDTTPGVWRGLSRASGQSVPITPPGTIDPNATGLLTNTVTVSAPAGVFDPNPANNAATDADTLSGQSTCRSPSPTPRPLLCRAASIPTRSRSPTTGRTRSAVST